MAMDRWLYGLVLILVAGTASGQETYQCVLGELTREITVVYETGVSVPCEVHYHKTVEAPNDVQVLWRAMNEEGYCEARAGELAAKLQDLGWQCGMASDAAESTPAESSPADEMAEMDDTDDTEALAPAEETNLR